MGKDDRKFIRIVFDSAPQGRVKHSANKFHAGETVSGKVLLRLDKPTEITNLKMEVSGKEETWFQSTKSASGMTSKPAEVGSERDVFPTTALTMHTFRNKVQGDYEFPFSFQLHPNLPGSTNLICPGNLAVKMQGGFCRTIYMISVVAENSGTFSRNMKASEQIFVNPAPTFETLMPQSANETTEVQSFFCFSHGSVNTELSVENCVVSPGQNLDVRIKMTNVSSKKIKLNLQLVKNVKMTGSEQNAGMFGADSRQMEFPVDLSEKLYKKIGIVSKKSSRNGVHDEVYSIQVPDDVQPDVSGTFAMTTHQLMLRAGVSMGDSIRVLIPIIVTDSHMNTHAAPNITDVRPADFKPTVLNSAGGMCNYHFNLIQMAPQFHTMETQRMLATPTSLQSMQANQRSATLPNLGNGHQQQVPYRDPQQQQQYHYAPPQQNGNHNQQQGQHQYHYTPPQQIQAQQVQQNHVANRTQPIQNQPGPYQLAPAQQYTHYEGKPQITPVQKSKTCYYSKQ
eukprot:gene809-421_t